MGIISYLCGPVKSNPIFRRKSFGGKELWRKAAGPVKNPARPTTTGRDTPQPFTLPILRLVPPLFE